MRRCLCPSGLLRVSRGSRISRSSPSLYPALSSIHAQSISSNARDEIKNIEIQDHEAILTHIDRLPPPPLGPSRNPNARYKWLPYLFRAYGRIGKSKHTPSQDQGDASLSDNAKLLDAVHAFRGVLYHSRMGPNFHLLNHIGFRQGQWSYVYPMLGSLVDTYEMLLQHMNPRRPLSNTSWLDSELSLHDLTGNPNDDLIKNRQLIPTKPPSTTPTLNNITGYQPAVNTFADFLLEETLVNLGLIVLEAANWQGTTQASIAMSYVYRILARLHHLDLISDRVYQSPNPKFHQSSMRPPGLHLLSGHIMSVISDAAWLEHEAALTKEAEAAGTDPPFVPFKVGVRELGPEIWFELILWICVEHGFNKQGAWLVQQMGEQGSSRWSIESWAPLMDSLNIVQQTSVNTEKTWRRPGDTGPVSTFKGSKKPAFCGLGPRTISSEVVSSMRDGLINDAYNGIGFHGSSPSDLIKYSAPLTALLDPPGSNTKLNPTNKITTGHIVRILESGCLSPGDDPIAFAKVIESTRNLVPPLTSNVEPSMELYGMTRAQLYDQTAAMAGLVEYSIKSSSHKGLAHSAFSQYALLQNIDDAGKVYHIGNFFEQLGQSDSLDVPFFDSQHFDASHFQQSSIPQVSTTTFADLLDLATAARSFDFGNWLLFNDDVDGPAIPPAAYSKATLAPSLLRFAAVTKNKELSDNVIQSLEMPLAVNTLKAMANVHVEFCNWDNAQLAFEYLRDYRLKSWGHSNIMVLGAKIVRLEAAMQEALKNGSTGDQERAQHDLSCATDLLQRFFSGDFNTRLSRHPGVANFQCRVLERTKNMFLEIPGELSRIANVKLAHKFTSRDRIHYVPAVSFNVLLSAVTETRGAEAGKTLFFKFCQSIPTPHLYRQREGGVTRLQVAGELDWLKGDPTYSSEWHNHVMEKAVIPNLNAVRILARAANHEYAQRITTQKLQNLGSTINTPPSSSPSPPPSTPSKEYKLSVPKRIFEHQTQAGGRPPSSPQEENLDICVDLFLNAGMPEEQVEIELPGHLNRLRKRGVFTAGQGKRVRDRYKEIQNGPWMKTFLKSQSVVAASQVSA